MSRPFFIFFLLTPDGPGNDVPTRIKLQGSRHTFDDAGLLHLFELRFGEANVDKFSGGFVCHVCRWSGEVPKVYLSTII